MGETSTQRGEIRSPAEELESWRQQLARTLLRAVVVVGALVVAFASYAAVVERTVLQIPIYLGIYAVVVVIAFVRQVSYQVQIGVTIALLCGFGAFNLYGFGINAESAFFFLAAAFIATLFFDRRGARLAVVAVLVILAVVGWLFATDRVVVYVDTPTRSADWQGWLITALVFLMLSAGVALSQDYLFRQLVGSLRRSRDLARELRDQRAGLEERVAERTAELTQRTAQLQTVTQVARGATVVQDVDLLLGQTMQLISDTFGFYHIGVFLVDETGGYAVLRAASSEGGRRLLAQRHRLRVGQETIVGRVASDGQHRIVRAGRAEGQILYEPNLSDARAEAALPLRAGGEIVGVLDVMSTDDGAFGEEQVSVLQTLADQIAVAISNARLFRQVQASLEAMRRAYGEMGLEAWQELLRTTSLAERYDPSGMLLSGGAPGELANAAMREGNIVLGEADSSSAIAAPIQVRGGQVIGVLDARKPRGAGDWSPQELELLQSLVDQLGVALDGAQLYQDSQERAERERVIGEVSARMRETLTVDAVLQAAVREIGEALGIDEVEVRMRSGSQRQASEGARR
jgi:GAF domain-containing protein